MRSDYRVLTGQKHESFTLCPCSKRFFGEVFFAYPSKKGEVERVSATTSPESPRYLNLDNLLFDLTEERKLLKYTGKRFGWLYWGFTPL